MMSCVFVWENPQAVLKMMKMMFDAWRAPSRPKVSERDPIKSRPTEYPKKYADRGKMDKAPCGMSSSAAMLGRFGTTDDEVKPEMNLKNETTHVVMSFCLLDQRRALVISVRNAESMAVTLGLWASRGAICKITFWK